MNKEKQRIKIAEVRGMIGPFTNSEEWFEDGDNFGWKIVLRDATGKRVPDLNDLNAMHEAEKTLRNQFNTVEDAYWRNAYWRNLSHVKPHPIYATAAQKSEALLKVLNLWEDE